LNDKVGVATPAKKIGARLHARVRRRASTEMLDGLSIIRLDYPLDIVDTPSLGIAQVID
jgi:hypothetical protein